MHQQARPPPPRLSSPASSPQASQSRSTKPHDAVLGAHQRTSSNVSARDSISSPTPEAALSPGPAAESIKKLDQIVQNFFSKAAILVLDARIKVTLTADANGPKKTNRWFQMYTEEIDDFGDELKVWKSCGIIDNRPPPMIIEVYLDASRLKENQSLVCLDDDGKRWHVLEQFNARSSGDGSPGPVNKNAQVVLEKWRVELNAITNGSLSHDFGPNLPTTYKQAIVFFRTLFVTTRLLPAWKFANHSVAKNAHPALVPRCRFRTSEPAGSGPDLLRQPIDGRPDPVTEYIFGDLDVHAGRLSASVVYRNDCHFRIDDSESLLSSQFMGANEALFRPSLPQYGELQRLPTAEPGPLRSHRPGTGLGNAQQAYGSLSTFHGDAHVGTSPLSALRAVRLPGSDTSSPPASFANAPGLDSPSSLPVSGWPPLRPLARPADGSTWRTSVSFQPFKAGSLSGSPAARAAESESSASTHSLNRPAGMPCGSQPRHRSSLTAGMPASLRGGPPPAAAPEVPAAGSPRLGSTSRYSSSFTHRRGRPSVNGASRADDEQSSSGRQSLMSSVARLGSGLLAETGPASSGSLQAEEDDISTFLKALDSKKTLKSLEPTKRGESATNRAVAQLSKLHMMRDSNNALGESMTSMHMHRSSSSSSRQLTSVPGMVAPASVSTSTSPGKAVSPHTPHTSAIPSRLSENSIIDYGPGGRRTLSRNSRRPEPAVPEPSRESTITQDGTTAIDIPLSPRLGSYQRRSSSMAQQSRAMMDDDDTELAFAAAHRSISLGGDDREPPTMSILLGGQMQMERRAGDRDDSGDSLRTAAEMQPSETTEEEGLQRESAEDQLPAGLMPLTQPSSTSTRRRYVGMVGPAARPTLSQSSRGSFAGSVSKLGRADEESVSGEPLIFTLSEMDAHGRRSMEDSRPERNASSERSALEPRGTTRRGWVVTGTQQTKRGAGGPARPHSLAQHQ